MATIFVQFSDGSQSEVIAYFTSPQDETAYPNSGTVESSDPRWKTFYESLRLTSFAGIPVPD